MIGLGTEASDCSSFEALEGYCWSYGRSASVHRGSLN